MQFGADLRGKVIFDFRSSPFLGLFGLFRPNRVRLSPIRSTSSPISLNRRKSFRCKYHFSVLQMMSSAGKLVNSSKSVTGHRLSRAASGERFSQESFFSDQKK